MGVYFYWQTAAYGRRQKDDDARRKPRGNSRESPRCCPPPPRSSGSVSFSIPSPNKKWFLFGGIGGGIALLALVAVVVLTQFWGGRQGTAASMLTLTPPKIGYGFQNDIAAIALDEDFQDLTGLDLNAEGVLEAWVGSLEIDPALLAGVLAVNPVEGEWNSERLNILEGNFEFADLRADLEDLEYEETSYREYEVWEDRAGRDYYALVGEGQYVLYSKSEDAVKAGLNSLYREVSLANAEDSDLKRVLDKVGSAPQVWFFNEDQCGIGRCRGYGVAFGGYDATVQEIPASFVLLFSSAQAAERAADEYDEIAAFVEEGVRFQGGTIDIADIASDGEFVVGSGKYVPPAEQESGVYPAHCGAGGSRCGAGAGCACSAADSGYAGGTGAAAGAAGGIFAAYCCADTYGAAGDILLA